MVFKSSAFTIAIFFSSLCFGTEAAPAGLEVTKGEIIEPLDGVNVTAGYGALKNSGKKSIQVEFIAAENFKAGEFHETITTKGQAEMRHLSALKISAGQTVLFSRGGSHLMLYDPTRKMTAGETIKVTLKVDGQKVEFAFKIVARPK